MTVLPCTFLFPLFASSSPLLTLLLTLPLPILRLTRRDVAWKRMGFQSENPFTDFRGMGVLTLECLIHLGRKVSQSVSQSRASRWNSPTLMRP